MTHRICSTIAGVLGALVSAAALAQTEKPASPLRSFDWTYQGAEVPGKRHWTSPDGIVWTETYPNGRAFTQTVQTTTEVRGCTGVITSKPEPNRSQTFIPDPGCPAMVLQFRVGAGDWRPLGLMQSISTEYYAVRAPAPAEHLLVGTALAFCKANHSRAAAVLSAAENSGWSPIPAEGGLPGAETRMKMVGGARLTLTVATMPMQLGGGAKAVGHLCQVGSSAPFGDLAGSVRAAMGQGPTADSGNFAEWIFTERDGPRSFLANDAPATMAAALKAGPIEIVHLPSHHLFLMYNELEAAP